MKLIIGLGNPGSKYEKTRHNAGFMAVDAFAKLQNATAWKKHHKAEALVTEIMIDGQKHLLAKPQTFMNDSGKAVQDLMAFYKIEAANLVVVHDELDLPFATLRIVSDSSAGGHNGVSSVIETIGTKTFTRLRIGVGSEKRGKVPTATFVLLPFSLFERLKLKGVISQAAEAIGCLLSHDAKTCMNRFN